MLLVGLLLRAVSAFTTLLSLVATLISVASIATLTVATVAAVSALLLFLLVEAGYAVLADNVAEFLQFSLMLLLVDFELVGLHTVLVEGNNLKHTLGRDGHQIGRHRLVGGVGHFALEDVGLEVVVGVVLGFKPCIARRHLLGSLGVGVDLKVEATL